MPEQGNFGVIAHVLSIELSPDASNFVRPNRRDELAILRELFDRQIGKAGGHFLSRYLMVVR
jgi:hypothetical protein